MPAPKATHRNPWAWVSTLYLAEGLPYVAVITMSAILYKSLGISNTDLALYTSWFYLPWVIKPLWSPVVDILKTRRAWIWVVQLVIGASLAGVALVLPGPNAFRYSVALFWLLAFSSATHDIAIDGFYLLATTEREQSFFVGIRSTFYRISMIAGQGLLVIFAGLIQTHTGLPNVELQIAAKPGVAMIQTIETNAAPFALPSSAPSELGIVPQSGKIEISPEPRGKNEIKELINAAKNRNLANGFYRPEEKKDASDWLSRFFRWLGTPFRALGSWLEPWLRAHFGAGLTKSDVVGNIGTLQLQLSRKPGREVTATLGLESGNKSILLAEGSRLIFNDQNWNKPALVIFQLDPELRTEAAATYEIRSGNIPLSWSVTFLLLAAVFVLFAIYHWLMLPYPAGDQPGTTESLTRFWAEFFRTFGAFFSKDKIGFLLLFLLLYRFAEAQLVKMVVPFLLDARDVGGLGLTTSQVGLAYGTVGIIALTSGGLLGGMVASKSGLKFWLWWMVLAIHLPDAVFVYLSYTLPDNFWIINGCVAVEQFGYGFGFTAYMLYMIYIARGRHATAHYAICTGFMALGMLLPGMFSGWLQEIIGYRHFFIWVLLATIPGFLVVKLIPLDAEFGRKT